MVEEDIPMPSSTMDPFIDSQKMDSTSTDHSFEFVSIKYLPEGGAFLKP